jgi:hypothetical protein
MQTELKQRTTLPDGRLRSRGTDETRELALLAEFMRHESVSSLANQIAERLGANVRGKDLIAAAELGASLRDC